MKLRSVIDTDICHGCWDSKYHPMQVGVWTAMNPKGTTWCTFEVGHFGNLPDARMERWCTG